MDDALIVGEFQPLSSLKDVVDGLSDRKPTVLLDQCGQVASVNQLHDQKMNAVSTVGVISGDDVGMTQLGGGFDFSLKPGDGSLVLAS